MAKTVKQAFETYASNLEITGLQQGAVSSRHEDVQAALEGELSVLNSFITGSYARNTMIAPLSQADIDIVAVLDPSYYEEHGPADLLERMKQILKKTYPEAAEISRNGQAVTLAFPDFRIDVVPAFNQEGGGYVIPSTYKGGFWIVTDPEQHVKISSTQNASHDGELVPLIKIIKGWNRASNSHFRPFHLEVLAWYIFEGVRILDYPSAVRFFLGRSREFMPKKNPDPAGRHDDVGYYIDTREKISQAVAKFTMAHKTALEAEALEEKGNIKGAIDAWQKIFGENFPAYG